ncbi:MAG: hypothetical protein IPN76_11295 [Saprospiraceae bacterium]|nr:hypothetical protein [Saprospiraceae bacterium]
MASFICCCLFLPLPKQARASGALMNDNFTYSTLMRDDLRAKNYLPTLEPYSSYPKYQHLNGGGNEMIADASVFLTTGENAILIGFSGACQASKPLWGNDGEPCSTFT